jgi:sensor histidine kinase regulating citrate/malate metabolism
MADLSNEDDRCVRCRWQATVRSVGSSTSVTKALPDDDGPGVPESERERVFERGYSTREEGTGFGLHIVSDVVEGHGWEVTVTESAAGGARFELSSVDRDR